MRKNLSCIKKRIKNGEQDPILKGLLQLSIKNRQFLYKRQRVVACSYGEITVIKDVHECVGQSTHSKAMASHKGRDSTYSKISERFFWYSIYKVV